LFLPKFVEHGGKQGQPPGTVVRLVWGVFRPRFLLEPGFGGVAVQGEERLVATSLLSSGAMPFIREETV